MLLTDCLKPMLYVETPWHYDQLQKFEFFTNSVSISDIWFFLLWSVCYLSWIYIALFCSLLLIVVSLFLINLLNHLVLVEVVDNFKAISTFSGSSFAAMAYLSIGHYLGSWRLWCFWRLSDVNTLLRKSRDLSGPGENSHFPSRSLKADFVVSDATNLHT